MYPIQAKRLMDDSQSRDDLQDWVRMVREIAQDLATRAQLSTAPDDLRREFVETGATAKSSSRSPPQLRLKGRLRCASPTRRL